MPDTVILDAMIARDDFAVKGPPMSSAEPIKALSIESLGSNGMLVPLLRKPDFQRETNHWTTKQVVSFLESFLDNELVPSIILWQSESYVFVIDGGHRISALKAWINDDYGDGPISLKYFSNNISISQKKTADKTRREVEKTVGKYTLVKDALVNQSSHTPERVARARNMATRSLSLQWVNGDADKAESSFFKINTQGTPWTLRKSYSCETALDRLRLRLVLSSEPRPATNTGQNSLTRLEKKSKLKRRYSIKISSPLK